MTALYGLLACGLLLGAAASRLPLERHNRRRLALAVFALAFIPLGEESAAIFLHGVIGAPSFTLAQLALLAALNRPLPAVSKGVLAVLIAAAGAFYALALGVGPLDPYGFGYRTPALPLLLLAPAWWLWRRGEYGWVAILAFDLAAYAGGLFANLWDALFDPLLVLVAVAALMRRTRT